MKNSVSSDRSFYIDSEEEDDEEKDNKSIEDGHDSDSSGSEAEHGEQQQIQPSSYNTQWPQSYRFSSLSVLLLCFPLFCSLKFSAGSSCP